MNREVEWLLTGRADAPETGECLTAGPVSALLVNGDLRTLTVGGVEFVRRIYIAVRDLDWNTIPGRISAWHLDAGPDSFEASFTSRHTQGAIDFDCVIRISGRRDGVVEYSMTGRARSSFPYAKIGLCVHHPIAGFAGEYYRGTTPRGEVTGVLPFDIGPQIHLDDGTDLPLFDPVSGLVLQHNTGGSVVFEFEGDLWEMEDQRNWSDASYKSASTPASLGYRHEATPGQTIDQRIVVTARDFPSVPDARHRSPAQLTLGSRLGVAVPPVGLGVSTAVEELSPSARRSLALVHPAHLRVDVPADGTAERRFASAARLAELIGSTLEVAVMLPGSAASDAELALVAEQLRADAPLVERVLVFNAEEESTSPASVEVAVQAFAGLGAEIVSGTNIYFNELNRHRIPPGDADGLAWSLNPQIHAFDELSMLENLQAQPDTVSTARGFAPGSAFYVTPITLRPRFNAVAVTDDESGSALPPTDPRQGTLFAAAWTLGSIAALAQAGVAGLTYFETAGPRGIIGTSPDKPFPVAAVIADACTLRGLPLVEVSGVDPAQAAVLAVQDGGSVTLLIANLTRGPLTLRVDATGFHTAAIRMLDQQTWPAAASDFPAFLAHREPVAIPTERLDLTMNPYATARVELLP